MMKNQWALLLPQALALILISSGYTSATEHDTHWSIVWENDVIALDDGGYSNGFIVNWGEIVDDENRPKWIDLADKWLPFPHQSEYQEAISYQVAHAIFTPSDIKESKIIEDDRPYAGLLYGAMNLFRFDAKTTSHYEFILGIVGPATAAEQLQSTFHAATGSNDPKGWSHQIKNEPVFRIGYEQHWRLLQSSASSALEYDFLAGGDVRAGTLSSDIGTGMTFRIGKGLASSAPMAWLTPGRGLPSLAGNTSGDWNMFGTLYANYVFNDITINGNTFTDSHHVSLKHEQARFIVGANYVFPGLTLSASVQESTDTFDEYSEDTLFATLGFSFIW